MWTRSFTSDNTAGASPQILAALNQAAAGHAQPYGADQWTDQARSLLAEVFEREVDLIITSTGSAANALALAALCPPWGSVLCHSDSHINNDECGAPEFYTGGAKLVPLTGPQAKLQPTELAAAATRKVGDVHTVQPSAVSITQATESGDLYSLAEVQTLAAIARDAGLGVHMDGARFANAIASLGCSPADMTWRAGVDILSFGATKNGALTADALVIFNRDLTEQLRYRSKRAGQIASKMRFHSAQIAAYLHHDLWLDNARHANAMSTLLHSRLTTLDGVEALGTPAANIVFTRLPLHVIDGLHDDGFTFYHDRWEPRVCRFLTSFQTRQEDVDDLIDRMTHHMS